MLGAPGSANCSLPANSVVVANAMLWLPDDLNVRRASIVEKEEDPAQAGGLQTAYRGLSEATSNPTT